eukprot:scaffold67834_cov22-Prasinocladus_malaysianus.AAC.1
MKDSWIRDSKICSMQMSPNCQAKPRVSAHDDGGRHSGRGNPRPRTYLALVYQPTGTLPRSFGGAS